MGKQKADCSYITAQVGQEIRKLRKEKNWSQKELGERCGIDPSHIAAIERGEVSASLDTLSRIADALGVDLKILMPDETHSILHTLGLSKMSDKIGGLPDKAKDDLRQVVGAVFDLLDGLIERMER